jgi:putative ABC transport system permease protein
MGIVVPPSTRPPHLPLRSKALADVPPERPVSDVETMENIVRGSTGSNRLPMLLLGVFSLLALVLAAVGIVGMVGNPWA